MSVVEEQGEAAGPDSVEKIQEQASRKQQQPSQSEDQSSRDPRTSPPPQHKKRRLNPQPRRRRPLQFTSELQAGPPQEYNSDGTPSLEYIRYNSTLQLKQRWDAIFDRVKDIPITDDDDEIDLGIGTRSEPFLIRNRGVLAALKEKQEFGTFHLTNEKIQRIWDTLKRAAGDVDLEEDEDELADLSETFFKSQFSAFADDTTSAGSSRSPSPERPVDPDLQAFLLEEQRRREVWGSTTTSDNGEEEDDSVVDFSEETTFGRRNRTCFLDEPGEYSASEDDLDVLEDDEEEEYVLMMKQKARNVQELLLAWDREVGRVGQEEKGAQMGVTTLDTTTQVDAATQGHATSEDATTQVDADVDTTPEDAGQATHTSRNEAELEQSGVAAVTSRTAGEGAYVHQAQPPSAGQRRRPATDDDDTADTPQASSQQVDSAKPITQPQKSSHATPPPKANKQSDELSTSTLQTPPRSQTDVRCKPSLVPPASPPEAGFDHRQASLASPQSRAHNISPEAPAIGSQSSEDNELAPPQPSASTDPRHATPPSPHHSGASTPQSPARTSTSAPTPKRPRQSRLLTPFLRRKQQQKQEEAESAQVAQLLSGPGMEG